MANGRPRLESLQLGLWFDSVGHPDYRKLPWFHQFANGQQQQKAAAAPNKGHGG
jgi:hypothetical protein